MAVLWFSCGVSLFPFSCLGFSGGVLLLFLQCFIVFLWFVKVLSWRFCGFLMVFQGPLVAFLWFSLCVSLFSYSFLGSSRGVLVVFLRCCMVSL